ncbi:MAG TPA: mevalonate kinase [Methanoregulaceae archaeon]|nr:mevalonate kinase [Methanoregulaceae archaeon]MDD3091216.1 mevalonate kinase [Methanoregulaceae archaeon]MDD5047329.1 mevalonate kinase [Methanoregulaceae archaeon]MDD5684169.1 mevalonate kinase [Methanoregulaceae archaeon]HOP67614.1 mevalonate kinase [Methanoregulaceae archaeon]
MATWSAPGKVFLFGEHAVVYGKPGIAMAIKPRVFVTVRKSKTAHHAKSPYIDNCFDEMGVKGSVYVNSQLPSSSGLGSSAAVTVATLSAINDEFRKDHSLEEIADMAFAIEKKVQKGRASPTDTSVSTFGGLVFITGTSRRRLVPQNFQMVIGNSMVSHNTSRMVEMVADLRKRQPDICEPILDAIGSVAVAAMHHMSDAQQLGKLMNMNHALLEALGVGHPALSKLILASRAAGAYGAKLTGAGGGGCMVALCPKHLKNRVAGAIEAGDARAFITTIDTEGVRKEKDV